MRRLMRRSPMSLGARLSIISSRFLTLLTFCLSYKNTRPYVLQPPTTNLKLSSIEPNYASISKYLRAWNCGQSMPRTFKGSSPIMI